MYRGNVPGQFNGSRMPSGQEYNAGYGMPQSGQGQIRNQTMQGHSIQRFSNAGFAPTSQMQYRTPQPGVYSNNPYGYSQGKIVAEAGQSFAGITQTTMSAGHVYNSEMQARSSNIYTSGAGQEMPIVSDSNISMQQYRHTKPLSQGWSTKPSTDMNLMQYGQSNLNAGNMYNGTQFMGNIPPMQGANTVSDSNIRPRHAVPMQTPSNYGSSDVGTPQSGALQSYQQQQYQQRPGVSSSVPSSMYMQQQYSGQPRNTYSTPQSIASTPMQSGIKIPNQYNESQMLLQQQNSLQQQSMKQTGQVYRSKPTGAAGSSGSVVPTGHQQQQIMGVPSNPLQQAMSPRHNSPLSPMRGSMTSRPNIPSASSQMQTSRTAQYPTPQASPHVHQPGPMSPSPRLPSYSPKQQMDSNFISQGQVTPGYRPSVTPTRVQPPRNDQNVRGFMSPRRMMSPPPSSQTHGAPYPQSQRMPASYNGDTATQQYYNQPGRFPHMWQGQRHQVTPHAGQTISVNSAAVPQHPTAQQVPKPNQYGVQPSQQATYDAGQLSQMVNSTISNQVGFQQMLNTPTTVSAQRNSMLSSSATTSDFDNDFNLESILGDPSDSSGSFMQQLQEVIPASAPNAVDPIKPVAPMSQSLQDNGANSEGPKLNEIATINPQQSLLASPVQSMPQPSASISAAMVVESNDSLRYTDANGSNVMAGVNEDNKLDSGEITLETTEQDLLKSTSSITIPMSEANETILSTTPDSFMKELGQINKILPISSATTVLATCSMSVASTSVVTTLAVSATSVENSSLLSPVKPISTDTLNADKVSDYVSTSYTSGVMPSVISLAPSTPAMAPHLSQQSFLQQPSLSSGNTSTIRHSSQTQPVITSTLPGLPPNAPSSLPQEGHPNHPGQMSGVIRPQMQGESSSYGPMHQNMMGMSRMSQPGVPQTSGMHPHDNNMMQRPPGAPRYPPMHPRYQQHSHPYGYGPHPSPSGPYPTASATQLVRPPYNQAGPHMQRGPHPGYMGSRPSFPPMHPSQQQHLQQQLQSLRHDAQQLQIQLQQAQKEEAESSIDSSVTIDQPVRSEQIRARLMEVDRNIRQIVAQLRGHQQHGPPQSMPDPAMHPHHPSAFSHETGSPSKPLDPALTPGGKKKRSRKQKASKSPKPEGEDGKKPPKKKKKKDIDGEPASEKKKKKKLKKPSERIMSGLTDTDIVDAGDGDTSQEKSTFDALSGSLNDESLVQDDTIGDIADGEVPVKPVEKPKKPESKKKKPPATVVKPKKKRKRGYDSSDEMNATDIVQSTPPPSPEDSLIEKRRSGRNVKRKRYVESVDLPFSGGEDDSDTPVMETKKNRQMVQMNDMTEADDTMIVDKILSHRKKRKRVKRKSETKEDPNTSLHKLSTEEQDVHKTEDKPENVSSNTDADVTASEDAQSSEQNISSGPMLSPSSLKNPRMRKFSMGVDQEEEEEIVDEDGEDEYFVKYKNFSYLHCEWKTKSEIEDKRFDQKLKRYISKNTSRNGQLIYPELEADELFNPDFVEVDRVLDVTLHDNDEGESKRHFLVKWCSLPYEDSTWEQEEDIEKAKIEEFEARCRYRPPRKTPRPHKDSWKRLSEESTIFCNNNSLRDYQFEGINWLLFNWYNKRNCILADEMGLGKTIQSITFLQKIFDYGIQGPFLIVAPLSTIANWQREFESWTTINAVVYHGSQTSRDMIQTYEWFCRDENLDEIEGTYKMHAVITTYEMVVLESPHLRDVDWRCLIIDEAHRLKNLSCKLVESLRNMQLEHKVLLTGTPLQNNVEELFALLSFLQPETFNSQQSFSVEFGNLKDNTQVEKLQELLKPMMLRRLKEDVEKSLAPKQETIIEVELTNIQKKYYRAILERNFEFLAKGTSGGNVPNLMNTMMELRKCCNHPYLIKGAEDKITQEQREMNKEFNSLQAMIQSSGKLVLIDKLLPRLKEGGHKVLVFSQMVRVLDILEDYLVQRGHLYERIDGCIRGNERQMAIDRFSRKGSDRFVFLLCTRAGGLGINLTAADTVIIFDSDWNPQNDLQAQARCHRIGQQKPVKVYRLITRNSYEREMFDKASLKLGLDKAVLQSISGRQDQTTNQTQAPQLSKHEVEDLLKRGAYGAIMDDDDAGSKFCEEDIDQILDRRAHTVTLESGEKGSTFSKASFVSAEDRPDISLDDPNFWEKWAKKADLDIDRLTDNKLILENPRNRKQTRRFGGNSDDQEIFAEIGSDSDDSAEYDSDGTDGQSRKNKFRSRAGGPGGGQRKGWGRRDCFRIEKCLLTFGWGRWQTIQQRGSFGGQISVAELENMARTVLMYCLKYYNGDDKIKFFMWDLITPTEIAEKTGVDLRNHEGLAAPVPRGRKGRRAKEDPDKVQDEQSKREWARDINLDVFLPDEGFKKHIQHQCNKVLLRVRMLYYLRTEILNNIIPAIDSGTKYNEIDFEVVDKLSDPPASWWDATCDKCLLIGIYKHGYEKYNLIRADSMLCFLEKVGPPDERALAAEMDVEPDGDADGDPEYKPTRITFNEMDFGQDSPLPGTPNTEPASPASVDANGKKKSSEEGKENDNAAESKKKEPTINKDWPSVSELNARLRRMITVYQKHYKQMQQRLMNLERRGGRLRYPDNNRVEMRRIVHQARWTRREEADFYRTVSTFGVERDPHTRDFTWHRFRNIARLDRKTDEGLRMYYLAFRNMCEHVCRWKGEPGTADGTGVGVNEEVPNIDVDPITEERASRTLYRVRLLDKVRTDVLTHPKLKERLKLCQRSAELPIWWRSGVHDHELLVAMDRHGVTRTEIHTLNDPDLTFLKAMREYEANPTAFKQKVLSEEKADLESLMGMMKNELDAKSAAVKIESQEKENDLKNEKEEVKEAEVKTEEAVEKMEVTEDKPVSDEEKKEDKPETKPADDTVITTDEAEPKSSEIQEEKAQESLADEEKRSPVPDHTVKEEELKTEESEQKDEAAKNSDDQAVKEENEDAEKTEKDVEAPSADSKDENKIKVEESPKTDESKKDNSADEKLIKEDEAKGALQMSLRSKTNPVMSQDIYNAISTSYSGFSQMSSPYMIHSMNGRWPKDRVLIQRVEHVCYCILNGEWPNTNQSLLPSMSNTIEQPGSSYSSRSQSSTPLSEGRGTPVPTTLTSVLPNTSSELNMIPANDKQLQAAMAQLLASSDARSPSFSSRRGRRKKPQIPSPSVSSNIPFGNSPMSSLAMDKSLQRKIEQLMAASNPSYQSSSPSGGLFTSQGSRSDANLSKSSIKSSNNDDDTGNSSASLLANIRELAKAESKTESSSSRGRSRTMRYSHQQSPSPSQSRSKDTLKSNSSDLLKSQQAFMASPEQLIAMHPPLQQMLQDAIKAGIDPMTAMTAFIPLFPMLDPFQAMGSSKPESLPQLPSQPALPPPGDMQKLLKSMGLPPELAMMPGFFPPSMMPSTSQSKPETRKEQDSKNSEPLNVQPTTSSEEKTSSSIIATPAKKKGVSKLDAMFGLGKSGDESPSRSSALSGKKSRKSKFVSPAMLPSDTRIPVHNSNEGIRLAGKDAPLNKDLADWLKDNSGFVVDYQALRQQLDESASKKSEATSDIAENESDSVVSPKPQVSPKDTQQKDVIDEAEALLKNAEKLIKHNKNEADEGSNETSRSRDKSKQSDFALPNPVRTSSPASSRGASSTPTSSSLKQQQLSELALFQQMNAAAAGLADPAAAALFNLPPEILGNLANLPPDVAALIASGFLPGGFNPELLAGGSGAKPSRSSEEKRLSESASPSRSSTPSRSSPSQRKQEKNPPSEPSQLSGDERVTLVTATGKRLTGRQAPELQALADYLRVYPDVMISAEWSNVLRKSKFLPKDLHSRLLPARAVTPIKSSAPSSSHSASPSTSTSNAALAAALGGLPPGAMFPGLMQGQGMMGADPMQLMAALQQMPGQPQMDMKALAAAGFPMFPFLGGIPNPFLGSGFPAQDPATIAAMAALSQTPPPKKERTSSSSAHERLSDSSRSRKNKKHNERHGERSGSGSRSSSFKQTNQSYPSDPMAEALAALQQSGNFPGIPNPFLAGAGNNSALFPPMMFGGQNNLFPMDMMSPELLAAQMAAFGGLPNMEPPKSMSSSQSSSQKREKRRGSSSSSNSHKPTSSTRSQSRGASEEQPMDLTQFSGGSSSKDRQTPDKHKH